jgi:hypothetical protein
MRIFGTTPVDELDRILALNPKLIVAQVGDASPEQPGPDPEYLRKYAAALDSHYEYLETIDHVVQIYRLRPFSAARAQPIVP